MPVARRYAYFDHAAVGPLTAPAARAMGQLADQCATSGDLPWMDWSRQTDVLRDQTAELLVCDRDEVTLIPNTTTGIHLVASGWPWRAGDSVVIPEGEFPSNVLPWTAQQRHGVVVRRVPRREGGVVAVDDLIDAIDATTRIIAVSWVGYASGYRVDLADLVQKAHERGVLVFVDAIQGLGMFDLDLTRIDVDFLAADGHKWLLGPEGAGVAVIRRRHLERLRCSTVGWASIAGAHSFGGDSEELLPTARRFEGGTLNQFGLIALSRSLQMFLDVLKHHGRRAIEDRVVQQAAELRAALSAAGAEMLFGAGVSRPKVLTTSATVAGQTSGTVTFSVPGIEPAEFRKKAIEAGVVVSCRGGGVRAAIHVYNDSNDIARLTDLI